MRSFVDSIRRRPLAASIALFAALTFAGVVLNVSRGHLFWGGYMAMAFFYALIFYLGVSAAPTGDQVEETLLAGRTLPLSVALFTMTATWVGGGFTNGTAESVARDGLAWTQAPWAYAVSLIIGGCVFAKPMRRRKFTTMLDPLEDRFGTRMAGVLYLPALLGELFWTASILTALGTTFALILDIHFGAAIVVSAIIGITYTSIGGLWAVAKTDVVQLGILMFGLTASMFFVVPDDGFAGLFERYRETMGEKAQFFPQPAWGDRYYKWWDTALLLIFGGIPWHVYFQRVLASKDEATAQRLSIGAGVLCLVAAMPAIVFGMVCATTDWQAAGVAGPEDASIALPYVLKHLAPPLMATLGLGAVAAAVMSSVDASILSAASMGVWNVYRPLTGGLQTGYILQRVAKILVWIVGLTAMMIALRFKSVYALWYLCSDLVYCVLFPQLVTALFDPKANVAGCVAGTVVSTFLRFGGGEPLLNWRPSLPYPMIDDAGVVNFPFRTASMLAGLATIMLVSRATQAAYPPRPLRTRD